jgi:hypothetical protein
MVERDEPRRAGRTMTHETHAELVANIIATMNAATLAQWQDGASWYPLAGRMAQQLADDTGHDVSIVGGVIAALSPRNPWAWNVADAHAILTYARRRLDRHGAPVPLPKVTTFNHNRDVAIGLACGSLSVWAGVAPKVTSFAANIAGNTDAVTVIGAARATGGSASAVCATMWLSPRRTAMPRAVGVSCASVSYRWVIGAARGPRTRPMRGRPARHIGARARRWPRHDLPVHWRACPPSGERCAPSTLGSINPRARGSHAQ